MTFSQLLETFDYCPATGVFRWKVPAGGVRPGDIAGGFTDEGYRVLRRLGVSYRAHRVAWLLMTGAWPTKPIDHINGVRDDNRWCNLREATASQNGANMRAKVGRLPKGVTIRKNGLYQAQICVHRRLYYLGVYKTPELASHAYAKAAVEFFGEFARVA